MNFTEALRDMLFDMRNQVIDNEWFVEEFKDKYIADLSTDEAYDLIKPTFDMILEESDEEMCIELLNIVVALCRKSNTTQIPEGILENISALKNKISCHEGYVKETLIEFLKHYRISDE